MKILGVTVAVAAAISCAPMATAITDAQANTICGWLRDPAWTMPQIESSTGDMLANDNPSFTQGDVFAAIGTAMHQTCPDVQRPF